MRDYLKRDETGVRRAVLELFLKSKTYTTEEVYSSLKALGFNISYRGISAMVGLMNTRLGILSIDVTGDHNIYSLKECHKDAVKAALYKL